MSWIVGSLHGAEARAQAPDERIPFGVKTEEEQVDPDPGQGVRNRPVSKPLAIQPLGLKIEEEQVDPDPGVQSLPIPGPLEIRAVALGLLLEGAPPSVVEGLTRWLRSWAVAARLAEARSRRPPFEDDPDRL